MRLEILAPVSEDCGVSSSLWKKYYHGEQDNRANVNDGRPLPPNNQQTKG